jgi:murein DD-endopeptidase MepM/ murein hydrolase activator NlpD
VAVSLDEYGLPTDGVSTEDDRVRRNETFAEMLTPRGTSYETAVLLARATKDVFDVRRIKAGRPYRVYMDDSLGMPTRLVYEKDRSSYVVFDLQDGFSAHVVERPTETRVRTISGRIDNSLYLTLMEQDAHPLLATRMSEVFAWQIDFYRIQKGDSFRIVYEEQYVGDERIGIGEILAARFNHFGEDFYAFHYADGEVDDHYDRSGQSLRKEFLMAPVEYSRISSGYTRRRFHPVQKRYKAHLGTDYVAPHGTPIHATGDGVISEAQYKKFNGNYVKIRHNGTYSTQYLHMSKIRSGIRPGVVVRQGDVIGYVGSTGLATGDHVCYRFWKNGKQVDHRREKFPSVGPIPEEHRAAFETVRDRYLTTLAAPVEMPINPTYAMLLRDPATSKVSP